MRKLLLLFITVLGFVFAETPVKGNAYIISSMNINAANEIQQGQTYSLVPKVVIYNGEEYIGSVTPYTGCIDSNHYTNGVLDTGWKCMVGLVNDLTTGGADKALSAEQGKILNSKINNIYTKSEVDNKLTEFISVLYPIGSVYISTINTNPSTLFAGTEWEAIGQGRTLVGVGVGTDDNGNKAMFSEGEIGGEYSHVLSWEEMPKHVHGLQAMVQGYDGWHDYNTGDRYSLAFEYNSNNYHVPGTDLKSATVSLNADSGNAGSSYAHNNIQPYLSVYMWKRIA